MPPLTKEYHSNKDRIVLAERVSNYVQIQSRSGTLIYCQKGQGQSGLYCEVVLLPRQYGTDVMRQVVLQTCCGLILKPVLEGNGVT